MFPSKALDSRCLKHRSAAQEHLSASSAILGGWNISCYTILSSACELSNDFSIYVK